MRTRGETGIYLFDVLNLTDIEVQSLNQTPAGYQFVVRATTPPPVCCLTPPVRNGVKRVEYRDLPMHGRHVSLLVDRQRYKCACGKTLYQPIPCVSDANMMTTRMVEYIEGRSLETPFTALGRELGIDESVARRIFRRWADKELSKLKLETPEVMGLDEIHMASTYRGVVTDVKNRTLFDMLPNRNKATVLRFLSELPNKERVKVVTMDMWNPYRDAVQAIFPSAIIVVDKFHVVRMANDAMERVRKQLRESLTPMQRLRLKDDRWILLRNTEDLEAHRRMMMETWFDQFPQLKAAYDAKEAFRDIWNSKTSAEAKERIMEWDASLAPEIEDAFFDLRRAMTNWGKEIVAFFDHRYTNAYTEAVNGIARIVNRAGRGYSFRVLRAKMLLASNRQKREQGQ